MESKNKLYNRLVSHINLAMAKKEETIWRLGTSYNIEIKKRRDTERKNGEHYDFYVYDWNGAKYRSRTSLKCVIAP